MLLNTESKLIFEYQETGAQNKRFIPASDVEIPDLAGFYGKENMRAEEANLPNLSEIEVLRHYTNLSLKNFGVENGPYVLGSCTMKYNPKINENMANLPGFAMTHPLQPVETVQGNLELLANLEQQLNAILGMDAWTFQPAAGAHGELTGVMMIKQYHRKRGDDKRTVMLIPDAAHGTNPASAAMAEFDVVEIKSNDKGLVDIEDLKSKLNDTVAGIMLTNPNTLGLFEEECQEITELVHEAGGLCYYDGANLNAIMMQARPGDMGFDVVHLNVHKTFSTPHGGGGPGAGPVGVKDILKPYLPLPVVEKQGDKYTLNYDLPDSIGKVRAYTGSFAIFVRTYAYILAYGRKGLREVSEGAVANANYLFKKVKDVYDAPLDRPVMHEFIITSKLQKEQNGITTLDIAKRLIDFGFHPPTIYFPLIVPEVMMVEPTETETLDGLNGLSDAYHKIAEEVLENPDIVREAPHKTPISRPDEATAARKPIVIYEEE